MLGDFAVGRHERGQLNRRLLQRRAEPLDRHLAPHVAPRGQHMLFDELRQIIHQDLPQPGQQLRLGRAAKLAEVLVGPQHRFLHHVRRAHPRLQPLFDLRRRQHHQVVAILLQQRAEAALVPAARG